MFSLLEGIWHGILSVPYLVVTFFVLAINGAIVSVGALLGVLLDLLPEFPDPPAAPGGVIGALLWFVPLGAMLAFFALMVTCWVTFLGIKVALKWVRAL